MTRDGTLSARKGSAMKNWRYIGLHAVAAATFIFCCSVTR